MKHSKIALIGMMGCGKSTISKLLAKELNYTLLELDEIFEIEEKISIKNFFEKHGEKAFRQRENEILKKASTMYPSVISCGGGIILFEENRNILFSNDVTSIYLKTSPETIYQRIKNDNSRPLLQVENPEKEIEKILSQRENFYNQAHFTITTDNKTKEEITQEILETLWKN